MWGQKEQQEHSQHGLYLLTHIHQTLQELIKVSKGDDREAQREIITLSDAAFPYAANGYRYNGLYVAGGETITVEYRGFSYSQVLQAGWNQLNLPDGCLVSTAGNSFMTELVRDKEQYAPALDVVAGTVTANQGASGATWPVVANVAGASGILANDVAAAAAASVVTGALPLFRTATVSVNVSAATTVTVNLRSAAGNWYQYATWTPAAAGTNAIPVTVPATGMQVVTSAAVTWTVEYQTAQ